MKTKSIFGLCVLMAAMMISCKQNEPSPPEPVVITAETDTAFQFVTAWDTICCPGMKAFQFTWQTTLDGVDTFDVYTLEIGTSCDYDVPTPVEYEGKTILAYAPMEHYMLITSPRFDESGQMIPYYYFTSTKAGNEVGKIRVGKINQCTALDSFANDDEHKKYNIIQCTVRITPSETGQDWFECRASVVSADKRKLSYHYIAAPIDYSPVWKR